MWWWENPHASCMSSIDLDINIFVSISAGPNHHGTPEHPIKITNGFVRKWTPCDPYRDIPKRIFKYVYIYICIYINVPAPGLPRVRFAIFSKGDVMTMMLICWYLQHF